MKTKIAALGEKDIMLIFKSIGVDVFNIDEGINPEQVLKQVIKESYKIIFVTETAALKLDRMIKSYMGEVSPSIVVIPGLGERTKYAVNMLRDSLIKAVGADVMIEKE